MNKKNIKTHLCAQLCHHVCQVLSCMAKNDWFFFSFPPSLLLLLSYTVFCSGHSYHLWNHVWPWDSLGIHTAIRGGYEMVPKVQGTIHILRKHIFLFFGPPSMYIHYGPSMISQEKTPWKDPRGGFRGVWGVFPRHLVLRISYDSIKISSKCNFEKEILQFDEKPQFL